MRILVFGLSVFLIPITSATAQASPQACSLIEDEAQRLSCFDTLFPKTPPAIPVENWEISETRSATDDSLQISALLFPKGSENKIAMLDSVALGLRCKNGITTAIISTGTSSAAESAKVTYSLNNEPAQTGTWERSANFMSIGLWSEEDAIPFIKRLKNNGTLFVRLDNPPMDAVFDLANVEDVIPRISTACRWD